MNAINAADRFRHEIHSKEREVKDLLARLQAHFDDPLTDVDTPAEEEARRLIDEASQTVDDVTARTGNDLDVLTRLAGFFTGTAEELRGAERLFVAVSGEVEARWHAVTDDVWNDDAATGYRSAVGRLADDVSATADDLHGIDDASAELGDAALEFVVALAQMHLERLDQWINSAAGAVGESGSRLKYWVGQLAGNVMSYAGEVEQLFADVIRRLEEFAAERRILERVANFRVERA